MRNFTKTFALLTMAAMSMGVMATTVNIPQAMTEYFNFMDAEYSGTYQLEEKDNNDSPTFAYGMGNTRLNTKATFTLNNAATQNCWLTMRTTARDCSADFTLTIKDGDSFNWTKELHINTTNNWYLNHYTNNPNYHRIALGELPAGTLTLEIEVTAVSGSYGGNYGYLAIHGTGQNTIPSNDTVMLKQIKISNQLTDYVYQGTTGTQEPRYEEGKHNIGYIKKGGWSEYIIYCSEACLLDMHMGVKRSNAGTIRVRIYDVTVPETAEYDHTFDVPAGSNDYADETFMLGTKPFTAGVKKVRFDYDRDGDDDPFIFNYNNLKFVKRTAADMTYERTFAHMNLNTFCFPYEIEAGNYTGATFYKILSTTVETSELTSLVLEEHTDDLEAGVPYFYDPEEGETKLVCTYNSGSSTSNPQVGAGGLTGFYLDNTTIPANKYVTVNNQLYKTGAGVTMGEYRAYVDPVAYSRSAMPGRKILRIGNGTTAIEEVGSETATAVRSEKILRDGQILIIRDGRTYNALGQEVR